MPRAHPAPWRCLARNTTIACAFCGWATSPRSCAAGLTRRVPAISACSASPESGTAAGVRRIEAVTGEGAMAILHAQSDQLNDIAQLLKGDSHNLGEKVRAALERTRQLEKSYSS